MVFVNEWSYMLFCVFFVWVGECLVEEVEVYFVVGLVFLFYSGCWVWVVGIVCCVVVVYGDFEFVIGW